MRQGRAIRLGRAYRSFGEIYRRISDKSRVSLCLDTAHIFEAGYNVRSRLAWKRILSEVRDCLGPEALGFFHLNDSKTPLGSNVDRHWHIGQGKDRSCRLPVSPERTKVCPSWGRHGNPQDGQHGRRQYESYALVTSSAGVWSFFLTFYTYAFSFSFCAT